MDYKERIEAAKEQLKAADAVEYKLPDSAHAIRTAVYAIYPELRESEDEKVRKAIIELVKQSSEVLDKQNQNNMIAWLEKQGEQKPSDEDMKEALRTEYEKGRADTIAEMRKKLSAGKSVISLLESLRLKED